jgi:hypothetical protein
MSTDLTAIATVELPTELAARTQQHLRETGRRGLEGMALWAGSVAGLTARITEVIVPRQQGHRTEHGLAVSVSGDELHRINVHLYRTKQKLLAQVHSHPTEAYHSAMDDRYAIATALGSFSIVVPDFATGPFSLAEFATYRLLEGRWFWDRKARWREVSASVAAQFIRIT